MCASSTTSIRTIVTAIFLGLLNTLMGQQEELETTLCSGIIRFECPPPVTYQPSDQTMDSSLSPKENILGRGFKDRYTLVTTASYDYVEVAQQGLGPIFVNTPSVDFVGTSINVLLPKPSWRSAFAISIGTITPSGWNIDFDYFLLYNKNNRMMPVDNTNFTNFAWQWNNVFNRFTLGLSKDCTPGIVEQQKENRNNGNCLTTTAFAALTYAFETQWFNTSTANAGVFLTTFENRETTQNWYAFGPYSGVELILPIPFVNYFSFILQSGMAVLPSKTRTHKNLDTAIEIGGVIDSESSIHAKNSFSKISTMFDFLLGMRISGTHFFLQLAWVGEIWPNHLQLFDYNEASEPIAPKLSQSNYSTNGLELKGAVLF